MDWEKVRFPGIRALHRRVIAVCGPASRFMALGHRFADWIEDGRNAPPSTVAEVELRVAGYLDQAATVGRRWGSTVGFLFGLVASATVLAAALLWTVLR